MDILNDSDCWSTIPPEYLWVADKLILARRLGYTCGPAGVSPPDADIYIVRPCVNFRMMSRGAQFVFLTPTEHDLVPDGYFWCEVFKGRHLSFDYNRGQQVLGVEGHRDDPDQLDRFSRWEKVDDKFVLPAVLQSVADDNEWLNVEVIGDRVIEVHFRYNDDFRNHDSSSIIPVWRDQFYPSECGDRLGFILKPGA